MTIAEVLAYVDEVKPNTYDENIKIGWLSEVDGKVFNDVILTHEREAAEDEELMTEFTAYTEDNEYQELLIPDTYADVYKHYLFAMIDYSNGESDRYTNSMIMYNSRYQEYTYWYNRTHKPIQHQLKVFQ